MRLSIALLLLAFVGLVVVLLRRQSHSSGLTHDTTMHLDEARRRGFADGERWTRPDGRSPHP